MSGFAPESDMHLYFRAGVTLMQARPKETGMQVVLCYLEDNSATPWVTWLNDPRNVHHTVLGHYFPTRNEAISDFKIR